MARQTLDDLAEAVYRDLKARRLHQAFTMLDVARWYRLGGGSTTRRLMRKVDHLAKADGLALHWAVPANGYVMRLTDQPAHLVDPALQAAAMATGVLASAENTATVLRRGLGSLTGAQRQDAEAAADALELMGAAARVVRRQTAALVSSRRSRRKAGTL
jgi:hypothetical protein